MTGGHIAVIDIGKTNAKLALVRLSDLSEVSVLTRPNTVLPGPPYPHFDAETLWRFVLDGLGRLQGEFGVGAITVTTHGASAALLAADGSLAAPLLDYEHDGPDTLSGAYDALRPVFAETGAPRLPGGLNLGAQLHWQFDRDPDLRSKVAHIVTYPQFWGHRLTGRVATDVTSLGCHTDLWDPYGAQFSTLPARLGLAEKFAPPRKPGEVLGQILPEIARATGLSPGTPVYCGIHDSNASLLPHLTGRQPPFSVVSTGTWVVAMTVGGRAVTLDPARDTLVNVNALGEPVPSARFMGGREYEIAMGASLAEADHTHIADVLRGRTMLLPALVPGTGPFPDDVARWVGAEPAPGSGQRAAAMGLYLALVTARCLDLIGHEGPVIVEGPFAKNRPYLWMLGVAAASPVVATASATGTSQGAAYLALQGHGPAARVPQPSRPDADMMALLRDYAQLWNRKVAE